LFGHSHPSLRLRASKAVKRCSNSVYSWWI